MKRAHIDFEYNTSEEAKLNLVCASVRLIDVLKPDFSEVHEFWLLNSSHAPLIALLSDLNAQGFIFVAFNVEAEARSFISLGLNPTHFKWIDIQAEYKMLLNQRHEFAYGKQFIKGAYKTTKPPRSKYGMTEDEKMDADNSKPEANLLASQYKLLGVDVLESKDIKDKMRDIILTRDDAKIIAHKDEIQRYCTSDVMLMEDMWQAIIKAYRSAFFGVRHDTKHMMVKMDEVLWRGECVARTALISSLGYPIDVKKLENISHNAPILLRDLVDDINSQFETPLFSMGANNAYGFKKEQKLWREIVSQSEHAPKWRKTGTGGFSLSADAFEDVFDWRHDFPRNNFFAQVMRYYKTESALKSFMLDESKKRQSIFDSLGKDGRVRSYLGPYGSQTARYQPKATSYLFLKTAWVRSLIQPPEGRVIVSIDYKSEEALICALVANDQAMIGAYKSGDVYLDFAKRAGAIPAHGTKETHKKERNLFKATYLGISYQMGSESLAKKLTQDTGEEYTQEMAQDLIDKFYLAYPDYAKFILDTRQFYRIHKMLKLFDGWIMWGDNDNHRSVGNFPVQGMGSCILRRAIKLAQEAQLEVIAPLHDALYIECDKEDMLASADKLSECMIQAFKDCFPDNEQAGLIQLDLEAWGPDLSVGKMETLCHRSMVTETIHVDERGKQEYIAFEKYLNAKISN